MKRIVIVEDEMVATEHLQRQLMQIMPDVRVEVTLQSIEEAVEYFTAAGERGRWPDLVLMDINLADGQAFRIFEQVAIRCPIVFTTAYDQYALEAFQAGGFDYLLKPICTEALHRALDKVGLTADGRLIAAGRRTEATGNYPSHFLVPMRDKLIPVEIRQVACFCLEDRICRAIYYNGRSQTVDRPLEAIMEELDPTLFFRANRQYIVAHEAIREIGLWPVSKLVLTLGVETPGRIIISKARVHEFKQWYTTHPSPNQPGPTAV
jgi:two-component system LytT family response regulator